MEHIRKISRTIMYINVHLSWPRKVWILLTPRFHHLYEDVFFFDMRIKGWLMSHMSPTETIKPSIPVDKNCFTRKSKDWVKDISFKFWQGLTVNKRKWECNYVFYSLGLLSNYLITKFLDIPVKPHSLWNILVGFRGPISSLQVSVGASHNDPWNISFGSFR